MCQQFTHLRSTVQWFSVYSQMCVTISTINSRTFQHLKKNSVLRSVTSLSPLPLLPIPFPSPPSQRQICFLSLWIWLFWAFCVCGLLCLASLTQHHVFKHYPCGSIFHALLLFGAKSYSIVWPCHILLIHSSLSIFSIKIIESTLFSPLSKGWSLILVDLWEAHWGWD